MNNFWIIILLILETVSTISGILLGAFRVKKEGYYGPGSVIFGLLVLLLLILVVFT